MRALLLLTLLLPPGCVTVSPPCVGAARPQLRAELIFGRSIKGGDVVSEAAWRRFLDEEVTPRFPDGFTVIDGRGQWRGEGQTKIVKEASKVLVVAMPGEAERLPGSPRLRRPTRGDSGRSRSRRCSRLAAFRSDPPRSC